MNGSQSFGRKGQMFRLAWPIFVELLLQMLVGNMDQAMVGRVSQTGVGAIGNANQLINLLLISFSVISTATTILVSQFLGSKKQEKVAQTYALSLLVSLVLGVFCSLALIFFGRSLLGWMSVPAQLLEESYLYLAIIGGSMVIQGLYQSFVAIFRSNALMKETMLVSLLLNLVNIAGNALLIGGLGPIPALGVAGAAISSVLSRLLGLIAIACLYRKRIGLKLSRQTLRPFPKNLLGHLLGIGLPSGGESLSYNFAQLCLQTLVNTLGLVAITTRVYANMFANISYLFGLAVSQAAQIMIGHLVGAGQADAAEKCAYSSLRLAMSMSFGVSLLLYLLGEQIFGLFTVDAAVIQLGKTILLIEIFLELGRAINMVMVRGLQATGDIFFPIGLNLITVWLLSVGGAYLLCRRLNWGLTGVWIAMASDECIRGTLLIARFRSGAWRGKRLV